MARARIPYSKEDLLARGPQRTYTGRNLDEIAFPLGGIGAGMVTLGGWGQLRDWEIMNRPAKGFAPPDSFFTLKVKCGRRPAVTKVIQGPPGGSYVGDGHSAPRLRGESLPHFRKVEFTGRFPFANVRFRDPALPIEVALEAFNPFIPLNDKDSSIPAAVFLYTLANTGTSAADAVLFGNLGNIVGHPDGEGRVNEARSGDGLTGLYLTTSKFEKTSPRYGSMLLATTWQDAAVWAKWKDARISKFWEAIAWSDDFPPENGDVPIGTVAARVRLKPGESVTIPFILTWHFPNFEHWQARAGQDGRKYRPVWRNYYATVWSDAWDAARYVVGEHDRLYSKTKLFHDALFASTLPTHVLDAVSSQISTLKTPTCLRLEDGTFYGFEGCKNDLGCCPGSCTHVWNYAQALPYLFPALQRSMREAGFKHSMRKDGFVQFRMPIPLGTKADFGFLPAADGQMGTIMQVYREWLICGDTEWLRRIWPSTRKALEFAWKYWDADKDGVMEGMQHNTYDIEFYGPNVMMGALYLGALRAGEEMARALGDTDRAEEYRRLFEKGSKWTDTNLWNGEYYEQQVEPNAHEAWPARYRRFHDRHGMDDKFPWPKWQFGKGCISDQMMGQWYAAMLGLGHLYDRRKVRKTLQSIFKYNWRADLSEHPCLFRIYAFNDEAGLLVGTWPRGERPGHAFYFVDEVWCGTEYQLASHLIYEGFIEQGLAIVKGVRDRHTGERRNPWDEFECGHHYSRSMASYALLTGLSGFSYSAPAARIGFAPRIFQDDFRTFFSVGSGWGMYTQRKQGTKLAASLALKYGSLALREFDVQVGGGKPKSVTAKIGRKETPASVAKKGKQVAVRFEQEVTLGAGETLRVTLGW